MEQVGSWIDNLPRGACKFAIVYHGDCDGVVSAVLFDYILQETGVDPEINHIPVRTEQYDFEQALGRLSDLKSDISIFLDLSIQNHPDKLQRAAESTKSAILVYDHHSQYHSDIPDKALYLNPSITPEGYDENSPPPCLFTARLAQKLTGKDFDWVACIGLIAESATERYLPLFQKLPQQFPGLCPNDGIQSNDDIFDCKLKNITYSIASAFWAPPGEYEHVAFNVLMRMVCQYAPMDFFNSSNLEARQLINLEKEVHAEINRLAAEAEYHSHFIPETSLQYAEVSSDYRVGGVVATRLVRKHKKNIVVTGQIYSGKYVIEARCGSGRSVNVAGLLQKATVELNPYSVGGHPAAAGATLPLESSAEFFIALENSSRML